MAMAPDAGRRPSAVTGRRARSVRRVRRTLDALCGPWSDTSLAADARPARGISPGSEPRTGPSAASAARPQIRTVRRKDDR
jgi:hypothetical protein